jgi:hypothetical protein
MRMHAEVDGNSAMLHLVIELMRKLSGHRPDPQCAVPMNRRRIESWMLEFHDLLRSQNPEFRLPASSASLH